MYVHTNFICLAEILHQLRYQIGSYIYMSRIRHVIVFQA